MKHFTKEIFKILMISIFAFLIVTILIGLNYEVRYNVKFLGQDLGYVRNKFEAEKLVSDYLNSEKNVAFIDLAEMPTYELKFVKKDEVTNEEERLINAVANATTMYYKTYAITVNNEVKSYVKTLEESDEIIKKIKETNNDIELGVLEVITTESKTLETVNEVASKINTEVEEKKALEVARLKSAKTVVSRSSAPKVAVTTAEAPDVAVDLGSISFIRPAEGSITSRFGKRSRGTHTGVDIANKEGTPIVASASGTVIYAGWKGSYGNLVIVSHGNGIESYYAHCSVINVTAGDTVSQGQNIANIGSTGNSTGYHVHLEIRLNGTPLNPENYI